jgi:hypothetical protein
MLGVALWAFLLHAMLERLLKKSIFDPLKSDELTN